MRENGGSSPAAPFYGFTLQHGDAVPPLDSGPRIGPALELVRGEPVRITVVNTLSQPTAVHWHGIELESYFDGVAGYSGAGTRLSPLIAPRDSFEVRMTPPRAGTFIYHTHVDEETQQVAGLAGPLLVLEPGARHGISIGETFDVEVTPDAPGALRVDFVGPPALRYVRFASLPIVVR